MKGHIRRWKNTIEKQERFIDKKEKEIKELEAESVSYITCKRQGIESDPRQYLRKVMNNEANEVERVDPYQIMRAAGHIENILGLTHPIQFNYSHNDVLLFKSTT